jgi:leucyl/phenylalanyl-tRNA--protein transferase
MSDGRHDPRVFWVNPDKRGILPFDNFHIGRRLARTVRSDKYRVSIDRAFRQVMEICAEPHAKRAATWINDEIISLYCALNQRGQAHSVECWQVGEDGREHLVGGLYGVSLGAVFFGESMFSRARDASKVALVHLVGRLIVGGYTLLDTQFVTEHLKSFGAVEIDRELYHHRLAAGLQTPADFYSAPASVAGSEVLQSITQTS